MPAFKAMLIGSSDVERSGDAGIARVAAAATIVLVEPVSCGLGGDCFAIVWDGKELHGLNSSGVAPAAWSTEYFKRKHGVGADGLAIQPKRGWDAVTVPGVVAGWAAPPTKRTPE